MDDAEVVAARGPGRAHVTAPLIPTEIETERLVLRRLAEADADAQLAVFDAEVVRYLDGHVPSRDDLWRSIATWLGHWELRATACTPGWRRRRAPWSAAAGSGTRPDGRRSRWAGRSAAPTGAAATPPRPAGRRSTWRGTTWSPIGCAVSSILITNARRLAERLSSRVVEHRTVRGFPADIWRYDREVA